MITPDVGGLAGFIQTVFSAQGNDQVGRPTELQIGDSTILVSDGGGIRSDMPGMRYVYVVDTDETYRLAIKSGAEDHDRQWHPADRRAYRTRA